MTHDPVNHPSHYTAYNGLEIIDLTEQMNFNRGNAVKYICRAGLKDPSTEVQDLQKAVWYIDREIARLMAQSADIELARDAEDVDAIFRKMRAQRGETYETWFTPESGDSDEWPQMGEGKEEDPYEAPY